MRCASDVKPSRPYFIRALIDWIVDSDCTPHLLILADAEGVVVPREHVREGRIVLNVSAAAVRNFQMDDNAISFDSRFRGQPFRIVAPLAAVAGVYAKENGQGMSFDVQAAAKPASEEAAQDAEPERKGAPKLKLVR